ncbi:MAG: hypothetical protein AB7F86_09690 [Bdellovibrionales bacterium]
MSYLSKLRKASHPTQEELYLRMRSAIETIEAAYDPNLKYDGQLKINLDTMPINDLDDIAAWETGWLKLIKSTKRRTT